MKRKEQDGLEENEENVSHWKRSRKEDAPGHAPDHALDHASDHGHEDHAPDHASDREPKHVPKQGFVIEPNKRNVVTAALILPYLLQDCTAVVLSYLAKIDGLLDRSIVDRHGHEIGMYYPKGMAVRGKELFIFNKTISVFNIMSGRFLRRFGEFKETPSSITIWENNVFVVDQDCITAFDADDGTLINKQSASTLMKHSDLRGMKKVFCTTLNLRKQKSFVVLRSFDPQLRLFSFDSNTNSGWETEIQGMVTSISVDEHAEELYVICSFSRLTAVDITTGELKREYPSVWDGVLQNAVVFGDEVLVTDSQASRIVVYDRLEKMRKRILSATVMKQPVDIIATDTQEVLVRDALLTSTILVFH